MYSVDELIDQIDRDSDVDDDLERIIEEDHTNDPERTEEKEDEDEEKKSEKKPRKKGNRPKLDLERLKGSRGLPGMEKLFSQIQFKGPGYERQDLAKVMNTLQYWTHRLFPKYSFDDTLEQLERLGTKKPVQTLKTKIVYDMLEEDIPLEDEPEINDEPETEPVNEFDLLMQQQGPITTSLSQPVRRSPERVQFSEEQKEVIERNRLLAIERRNARLEAIKKKQEEQNARFESLTLSQADNITQESATSSQIMDLTKQQLEIIERNRKLAIEKRKAKMGFLQSQDSQLSSAQIASNSGTTGLSQNDTYTSPLNNIVNNNQNDDSNNMDVDITEAKESNNIEPSNNVEINLPSKVIDSNRKEDEISVAEPSNNLEITHTSKIVDSEEEENEIITTKSSYISLNNTEGVENQTKNITGDGINKQREEIEINKKQPCQDDTIEAVNKIVEENTSERMDIDEEMI